MLCFAGGALSSAIGLGDGLGLRPSPDKECSDSTLPFVLLGVEGHCWSVDGQGGCSVDAPVCMNWPSVFWRFSGFGFKAFIWRRKRR